MKKHFILWIFLLSFVAIVSAGCGGDSGGSSATSTVTGNGTNLFAGSYDGTWTLNAINYQGKINFAIMNTGAIQGTMTNTTINDSAFINGTINDNGVFSASYVYTTSKDAGTLTGILLEDGAGAYFSNFTNKVGQVQYTGNMQVKRN